MMMMKMMMKMVMNIMMKMVMKIMMKMMMKIMMKMMMKMLMMKNQVGELVRAMTSQAWAEERAQLVRDNVTSNEVF